MDMKKLPTKLPNNFIAYKPFDTSRISILLAQEILCFERIIVGLQNYLNGNDFYGKKDYIKNEFYGFKVYDLVAEYINNILYNYQNNIDTRSISLIYNRFHFMRLQTEFIKENYSNNKQNIQLFIDDYSEMEQNAKEIMYLQKLWLTVKKL